MIPFPEVSTIGSLEWDSKLSDNNLPGNQTESKSIRSDNNGLNEHVYFYRSPPECINRKYRLVHRSPHLLFSDSSDAVTEALLQFFSIHL